MAFTSPLQRLPRVRTGCRRLVARMQCAHPADDRGAAMSEYGMLIFFVGIAAFGILVIFGGEVWELFRSTEEEFDASRQIPPPAD